LKIQETIMNQPSGQPWWQNTSCLIAIAALGVAILYLASVHIDHVLKFLPLLFILACPLMHVFMHRGHKKHRHGGELDKVRDRAAGPEDTQGSKLP
jgi:hypothetical protein